MNVVLCVEHALEFDGALMDGELIAVPTGEKPCEMCKGTKKEGIC